MDEKKYSIIAKNISKGYKIYSSPKQKLLDLILPKGTGKTFYALKDLSFKVEKGDVVGLLGLNGSGKSTLSNILGGVSMPTSGEIQINGESALIAIGLGMNNFLTGIENIELKTLMMGYKKDEIEEIKQEIIDFADIGEFINQPLRTYSSGMRSRLGFAISVYTNPDILVIDEALSVGDPTFTQKCLDKMNEFKKNGKTIFFVSHSLSQVRKFCNKAIWLEYGILKEYGNVDEVLPKYQEYVNNINKMTQEERAEHKKSVLKNKEHSLLKDFKLVDKSLKNFVPTGKLIKIVNLINNENKVKSIFFNIDISTLAFGFIPSILRKRYESAVFVLIAQVLNFFIIPLPFSIITNFIITGIAALFTSKSYIDYLIEEKRFIPHNIWEKVNDKNEKVKSQISINNKRIKKLTIISIIYILISSIALFGYMYRDSIKNIITANNEQIKIANYAIITHGEDKIDSLLILNSKGKNELNGVVYPGEIQIHAYDKVDELKNLINIHNVYEIKQVVDKNFNIQISDYILVNKNDINNTDNSKDIDLYEKIISDLLALNKYDLNEKANKIEERYSNIDKSSVKDFYNSFKDKNINISKVNYDVVLLGDIVEEGVLKALNLLDLEKYELLTMDKRILTNNELIKSINERYSKHLENEVLEEEPTWEYEYNYEESINEESSDVDDTVTSPNNNEQTGTNTSPSTGNNGNTQSPNDNNTGSEESTKPPSDDNTGSGESTKPPSDDNTGSGESTKPPSSDSNTGSGESTKPPSSDSNTGSGESATPPSDNNTGSGESATPPSDNNAGSGESTTPPSDNNAGSEESITPPSDSNMGSGENTEPPSSTIHDEEITEPSNGDEETEENNLQSDGNSTET